MTPEQSSATEKMTSVKADCVEATAGPKKDRAMKHYRAAEKAHEAKNYAETSKELETARQALS